MDERLFSLLFVDTYARMNRWVSSVCAVQHKKELKIGRLAPPASHLTISFDVYHTCAAPLPPTRSIELAISWVGEVGSHTRLNYYNKEGKSIPQDRWFIPTALIPSLQPDEVSWSITQLPHF